MQSLTDGEEAPPHKEKESKAAPKTPASPSKPPSGAKAGPSKAAPTPSPTRALSSGGKPPATEAAGGAAEGKDKPAAKGKMPPPAIKKASTPAAKPPPEGGAGGVGGGQKVEGDVPAPSNPASCTIRVDGFVRPLQLQAAQRLMEEAGGGKLVAGGFWMDAIKTHCFATFEAQQHAERAREALYNLKWPADRGQGILKADFSERTAMDVAQGVKEARAAKAQGAKPATAAVNAAAAAAAASAGAAKSGLHADREGAAEVGRKKRELGPSPEAGKRARVEEGTAAAAGAGKQAAAPVPSLDDLFRATKTKPKLYYLPVSEEKVAIKRKERDELKRKRAEAKRARTS
jgi:apoptotic chromatin condensation inducer in the nucleus